MGKFIDMTGWKMWEHGIPDSRITVLNKNIEKYHPIEWWCQCSCGKIFSTRGTALRDGTTRSCGCLGKEHIQKVGNNNSINLIGKQFNYLTVIDKTNKRYKRQIIWKCQCKCGKIIEVCTDYLNSGRTASCGCLRTSLGEKHIKQILDDNKIKYYYNKNYFKDLLGENNPLRFDFILIDKNSNPYRLIEFDGPQHNKPNNLFGGGQAFNKLKKYDKIKNQYAKQHNLPLVRIPYKERDNITLEMLMSDKYLIT